MKKHLLLFALLLSVVMQAGAQSVKVPKWEKFVVVNKKGVNLRKAPNTQSPRLMSSTKVVEMMYSTTLSWTAKRGARAFSFDEGTVLPVIDETDQWYHVYVNYEDLATSNKLDAYIHRDFCTPVEPVQMQTGSEAGDLGFIGQPYKVKGNKGLYVAYYENDMEGNDATLGKALGLGVVWLCYDGFYDFLTSISGNNDGIVTMDMNKITEQRILNYMKGKQMCGCTNISYQFPSGPVNWTFDPDNNYMPMTTTTLK